MKTLKAKTSHPKKQIFPISDLTYIKYYEDHKVYLQKLSEPFDMIKPIEINKHEVSPTIRYGAGGKIYKEKKYSVLKGNQRVTLAKKLGYTHIEGIIMNDEEDDKFLDDLANNTPHADQFDDEHTNCGTDDCCKEC